MKNISIFILLLIVLSSIEAAKLKIEGKFNKSWKKTKKVQKQSPTSLTCDTLFSVGYDVNYTEICVINSGCLDTNTCNCAGYYKINSKAPNCTRRLKCSNGQEEWQADAYSRYCRDLNCYSPTCNCLGWWARSRNRGCKMFDQYTFN